MISASMALPGLDLIRARIASASIFLFPATLILPISPAIGFAGPLIVGLVDFAGLDFAGAVLLGTARFADWAKADAQNAPINTPMDRLKS